MADVVIIIDAVYDFMNENGVFAQNWMIKVFRLLMINIMRHIALKWMKESTNGLLLDWCINHIFEIEISICIFVSFYCRKIFCFESVP